MFFKRKKNIVGGEIGKQVANKGMLVHLIKYKYFKKKKLKIHKAN